jgi:2-dehydro-3-deoxyphosphogluconate aldolase/(4S)-4-hydroxy-2-oxoglutarate aldolase
VRTPVDRDGRTSALATLREVGIIPVIRADSAGAAQAVVEVLADAGLAVAEVTMTVPDAIGVIASVARRFGDRVLVGAGTVTDGATAERAVDAGAAFIASPCLVSDVVDVARQANVPVIPGALTPTEILHAHRQGGDMVKVFPVQSVGGAAYLRTLRGPFPTIPVVPSGGVTLENVGEMLAAGAAAVGVGGEMISRDALARRDYASIGAVAAKFLEAVRLARAR